MKSWRCDRTTKAVLKPAPLTLPSSLTSRVIWRPAWLPRSHAYVKMYERIFACCCGSGLQRKMLIRGSTETN